MARILVVDDVEFIARMIASIFEQHGHEAIVAADGDEAIAAARETLPDLILLDVNMPRVDGLETARILKSDGVTHHIPIMMVTAQNDTETVAAAYAADVSEYVVKPFEAKELLEKAALLLDGLRMDYSIDEVDQVPLVTILHDAIALGTLEQLPQALQTARGVEGKPIILDVSRVRKVGDDVLAAIADFERKIRQLGGELKVVRSEAGVGPSAIFPGLKESLAVYGNREDALAAARSGPGDATPDELPDPTPEGTAADPPADVDFEEHDHLVIVRVRRPDLQDGVIDHVVQALPKSAFMVLLDLKEVEVITPVEARAIQALAENMTLSGRGFKIANPNPLVSDSLHEVGLGNSLFWMREKGNRGGRRSTDR